MIKILGADITLDCLLKYIILYFRPTQTEINSNIIQLFLKKKWDKHYFRTNKKTAQSRFLFIHLLDFCPGLQRQPRSDKSYFFAAQQSDQRKLLPGL